MIKHLPMYLVFCGLLNVSNAFALDETTDQNTENRTEQNKEENKELSKDLCQESTQEVIKMMVVFNPNGEDESWNSSLLGMQVTTWLKTFLPVLNSRLLVVFKCNGIKARFPSVDGAENILDPKEYVLSIKPRSAYTNSRVGGTLTMSVELLGPVPRKVIWRSLFTFGSSFFGFLKTKEERRAESADKLLNYLLGSFKYEGVYVPPNNLVDFHGKDIKFKISSSDTGFAELSNINAIPYLSEKGRTAYSTYLTKQGPRAFAIAPNGSYAWVSGQLDNTDKALISCNKSGAGNCKLYSVNYAVVWKQPIEK